MCHRFQQQTALGITPISEVKFPLRSRDELPPVLMGLQHIFVTPELSEKIFALLEKKIVQGKKRTGRKGMDLWHILILTVVVAKNRSTSINCKDLFAASRILAISNAITAPIEYSKTIIELPVALCSIILLLKS
jgi:hypothetical protein